jgi:hypothetical protein
MIQLASVEAERAL